SVESARTSGKRSTITSVSLSETGGVSISFAEAYFVFLHDPQSNINLERWPPAFAKPPTRNRFGVPWATAWQADLRFCTLKLRRCPRSLAATLRSFTLITRTALCSRQLP